MSNALYPDFPGVSFRTRYEPMWKTDVQESVSGRETRVGWWSYPRYRIDLDYEVLRADSLAEFQTLIGFFNARGGRRQSFLFDDPVDNAVTAQVFGTGVAGVTQYQLVRTFGGFVEPVTAPKVAGRTIYINGIAQTEGAGVSINNDTGVVTFSSPPTAGATMSWTGGYYRRVRFSDDYMSVRQFTVDLWSGRVSLMTVKE